MHEDLSSPRGAVAFVRKHGVILESGRGSVPSLADAIAGETIRGSWWGHAKARAIFQSSRAVRDSPDVLVCRLLHRKITFVHRRMWPALVRLADIIGRQRLDAIREEHTPSGAHRLITVPFPRWVPSEVAKAAEQLSEAEARKLCVGWLPPAVAKGPQPGT